MDNKAKKILFDTYWKNGWVDNPTTPVADFEYAKSRGLMFDPFSITHDECIKQINTLVNNISFDLVAKAFLSSLSTRMLSLRSGVASYFIAKQISLHSFKPTKDTKYLCNICRDTMYGVVGYKDYKNEDLNVLNFERIKWGGVRHGDILYTLFDLQQFIKEDISEPNDEDIRLFRNILYVIENCEPNDYPSSLEKKLKDVIKSSKDERDILIEILACIGILKPKSFDRPVKGKSDWVYVEYWRGEDKYDKDTVNNLFGKYIVL